VGVSVTFDTGRGMAERQLTAVLLDEDGQAGGVLLAAEEPMVVALDSVVADIEAGRHRYWLLVADGPILIELAESDGDIYGRLMAHDAGDPLNRLADLPHHERSLWQDADDILPLKPRPLSLAGWKGRERTMAATAVVLIAVTVVLLLRPISWAAVGGQQPMPGVMTIPKLYIVFVPVAMALASFILMRSLLRISHWSRALCVIGLALLAVDAGARIRIEAFSLVAGRATTVPPAAMHAVSSFAESGLLAELLAIVGACIAVRAAPPTSWRRHVAPWLVASAFLLPVLGYLASLELPAPLAAALHAHQVVTDASWSPASSMAAAVLEPYHGLLYMALVLAAWQAVTFSQAIGEAGPKIAVLTRRVPQVLLLAMTAAKLAFDVTGYLHRLPTDFGGGAALWDLGVNSWAWPVALLIVAPAAFLLLRRIRLEDTREFSIGPVVILAAIYSLFGPIQVVAQTLLDFDPALGVHPPPGSPLFIPPNVVIDLAAVLTFAGLLYYWQRQRPAAAVFGFSLLLQLPGVVNSILGTTFPIPGLGQLDTILSAAIFLWCLLTIIGAAPRVPTLLWALWIGLTILTHFNTLVPDTAQSALFTIFAVLPVAYTLLWAAEPLNKTAKRAPEQATLALGLMATLLIVVSVQVWLGDRFGRIDNTFIHDGSVFQLATRQVLAMPLLAVLLWVYFLKHRDKVPARES
jgi:hypothetical protein